MYIFVQGRTIATINEARIMIVQGLARAGENL